MKNCKECEGKKAQINYNCFKQFEYLDFLEEKDFINEIKSLVKKIKEKLNLL